MDGTNKRQEKVRGLNGEWEYFFENEYGHTGDDTFYMYEPFELQDGSVPYWTSKHRIVFCNLNAFGEGDESDVGNGHMLSWNTEGQYNFYGWLSNKPGPTIRNTVFFIDALLKKLNGKELPESCPDYDSNENNEMMKNMQQICYMNIYPIIHLDENKPVREWEKIRGKAWDFYDSYWQSRSLMRDMIDALEPDVFIVTGEDGANLLNRIFQSKGDDNAKQDCRYLGEELSLDKWGVKRLSGTSNPLFVSMKHPSRSAYSELVKTVQSINV